MILDKTSQFRESWRTGIFLAVKNIAHFDNYKWERIAQRLGVALMGFVVNGVVFRKVSSFLTKWWYYFGGWKACQLLNCQLDILTFRGDYIKLGSAWWVGTYTTYRNLHFFMMVSWVYIVYRVLEGVGHEKTIVGCVDHCLGTLSAGKRELRASFY